MSIRISGKSAAAQVEADDVLGIDSPAARNTLAKILAKDFLQRSKIINPIYLIAQENGNNSITGFNSSVKWVVDGYSVITQSQAASTFQRVTDAPAGYPYSLKYTNGTGAAPAAGDFNQFQTSLEGVDLADWLIGTANAKTVTLQFWAKASITGTYGFCIDNYLGTARNYLAQYTINAANTWEWKVVTIALDTAGPWNTTTTAGGMSIKFDLGSGSSQEGTAGSWGTANLRRVSTNIKVAGTTGATWQICDIRIQAGSVALPTVFLTYEEELRRCLRRLWILKQSECSDTFGFFGIGMNYQATHARVGLQFPVIMRAAPAISVSAVGDFVVVDDVAGGAATAISLVSANTYGLVYDVTMPTSTAHQPCRILANNSASAWMKFDAQLF